MGVGTNLVTTVIGFGMSAAFIVFVCTRLLCASRARSSDSPAGAAFDPEVPSDLDQPEHDLHGLSPAAVAAFPTVAYNRGAFISRGDPQCSICLAEYQEGETLRVMPTCGHDFHLTCIDVWLQKQSTCPICRSSLRHDSSLAKGASPSVYGRLSLAVDTPVLPTNRSHSRLQPRHGHPEPIGNNQDVGGAVRIDLEGAAVRPSRN